jgi:hypothetical protein
MLVIFNSIYLTILNKNLVNYMLSNDFVNIIAFLACYLLDNLSNKITLEVFIKLIFINLGGNRVSMQILTPDKYYSK